MRRDGIGSSRKASPALLRAGAREFAAEAEREEREGGAAVGDEVVGVGVERARPPTAGLALVGLEPRESALNPGVLCGDTGFAEHNNSKPGHVAVARRVIELRLGSQLLCAVAAAPLLRRGKSSNRPPAIRPLVLREHLDQLLLLIRAHQSGQTR